MGRPPAGASLALAAVDRRQRPAALADAAIAAAWAELGRRAVRLDRDG
ncbi:hypothetical protein KIF24_16005 [Micromonospora sp. Llam7]|nr:hypothetical protein [Micromonospora tarapacensis]MBX7267383.1 hypothetical protein [Micromonospora tarapacensis]